MRAICSVIWHFCSSRCHRASQFRRRSSTRHSWIVPRRIKSIDFSTASDLRWNFLRIPWLHIIIASYRRTGTIFSVNFGLVRLVFARFPTNWTPTIRVDSFSYARHHACTWEIRAIHAISYTTALLVCSIILVFWVLAREKDSGTFVLRNAS